MHRRKAPHPGAGTGPGLPWDTLKRFNLAATPTDGTQIGIEWILLALDPDGNDGYGGQIQCWGWGGEVANYTTFLFSDQPAGPVGTAVEADAWGRIKSAFN